VLFVLGLAAPVDFARAFDLGRTPLEAACQRGPQRRHYFLEELLELIASVGIIRGCRRSPLTERRYNQGPIQLPTAL